MTTIFEHQVINTNRLMMTRRYYSKPMQAGVKSDSMTNLQKVGRNRYLNEHNKDVIVEVVDGIGKIKLPDVNYGDAGGWLLKMPIKPI